jgi:hypothetical protein
MTVEIPVWVIWVLFGIIGAGVIGLAVLGAVLLYTFKDGV